MDTPRTDARFLSAATAVTLLGLGFALGAAALAVAGRPAEGFVLLIAAGLSDLFDGWVARRSGRGGSALGGQLDSLVDVASFGVVPMVLVFTVAEAAWGPSLYSLALITGWIYASCVVLRLARFNLRAGDDPAPPRSYRGVPVTYAALVFPVVFAAGEAVAAVGTPGLLVAATLLLAVGFVVRVPVPKPRGMAYPFFIALAAVVAWYLLTHTAASVVP